MRLPSLRALLNFKTSVLHRDGELTALVAMAVLYLLWFSWPIIVTASSDDRLVSVFSSDEALHLELVRLALENGDLNFPVQDYGHLYFNIATLALWPLHSMQLLGDREIVIGLRLVSVVFGAASVVVTFLLARLCFGRVAGWLAAIFLATTSWIFLEWSTISHPDTLQLFLLVGGLYAICHLEGNWHSRWLVIGALAAGLAFAAKYSGAFLVPFLWVAAAWRACLLRGPRQAFHALGTIALIGLVFGAAFVASSPYSLVDLRFLAGIRSDDLVNEQGNIFGPQPNGIGWLNLLLSGGVAPITAVLACLGAVLGTYRLIRRADRRFRELVLLGWLVGYLLFLTLRVNRHLPHYLLPIIPVVVVLAAGAISSVAGAAKLRQGRHWATPAVRGVVVVLLAVIALGEASPTVLAVRDGRINRETISDAVVVGKWLAEQYGDKSKILYDQYSYVPARFHNALATWAGTLAQVRDFAPDVIVVHDYIALRFADLSLAAIYPAGAESFRLHHEYYSLVKQGRIVGYRLARSSGPVNVYARDLDNAHERAGRLGNDLIIKPPTVTLPPGAKPINADFADGILLKAALSEQPDDAGKLNVKLFWQATGYPRRDYSVSVQLLAPDGKLVAQNDGRLGASFSTGLWDRDDSIAEERGLSLPSGLPAGTYSIGVAVYDLGNGERLTVSGLEMDGQAKMAWLSKLKLD